MRFRQRIEFIDPNGLVIETVEVTGQTDVERDEPGDPKVYAEVAEKVGRFAAAMASEGLTFEVRTTNLCTFPGCDDPAGITPSLCDNDARATL